MRVGRPPPLPATPLPQGVQAFEKPKAELEQYPTAAHIASRMLMTMESDFGDLEDRSVCDLGCGAGVLSIGAAVLGAGSVLSVDVDPDALRVAQGNAEEFDGAPIDFVLSDVAQFGGTQGAAGLRCDTVVMNPPFGTKRKGADVEFLRAAAAISSGSIYSLHKTSTRAHIAKVAATELQMEAQVLAELRYDLPKTMSFHKKKSVDVEVDLWRFEVSDGSRAAALAALVGGLSLGTG